MKTPLFARMVRNSTIRAGFCLCAVYMRRDRTLLKQLFAALGSVLLLIIVFEQEWMHHSFAIGFSPGFSVMFYFVGISLIGCFISPIRYSEHWKASWMLTLTPVPAPDDLWRGAQVTAFVYMVAPCTLSYALYGDRFLGCFRHILRLTDRHHFNQFRCSLTRNRSLACHSL